MLITVTKDVANHKINPNYECLLIQFEKSDKHYFENRNNWMPTDEEVIKICAVLLNISPTFRRRFKKTFREVMKDD